MNKNQDVARNKQVVRVLRQLDSEAKMLDNLQQLCNEFTEMVAPERNNTKEPLDLRPAQDRLAKFVATAEPVVKKRAEIIQLINTGRPENERLSVRSFIQSSPQPIRSELENRRVNLVQKMHDIKTQIAGDTAVVYYSFDYYRRIVNALVNCVAEEQNYDQAGKSAQPNSGKLIERAC